MLRPVPVLITDSHRSEQKSFSFPICACRAMQFDFRPWFDSPSNADILLHVCREAQLSDGAATTPCGQQDETAQQQRCTEHAVDVNEGGQAGSSKQAPDQHAPSEQPDSSRKRQGQDSDGSNADPATKRCRRAEGAQQRLRTYHAHALALCAQSQFFKASMSDMWQQQQQQQPARDQTEAQQGQQEMQAPRGGPQIAGCASNTQQAAPVSRLNDVTITIQVEELQAMDLVLRTIYGFKLPAVSPDNIALLFQCLHLADRFDVLQCADLILTGFKGAVVTAQVLQHVCDAPPGVVSRPAFQDLVGRCKDAAQEMLKLLNLGYHDSALMALANACKRFIAHVYGDVPAVIRSQQLRGEFCSMLFDAVLAWAESDELRVHSENCVVYLLSAWVKAAQQRGIRTAEKGVSSDQLGELSQQVRVLHLGPAYQQHILPQLGLFKGCSGMAHLPTLLAYKGKDAAGKAIFPSTGLKFPAVCQEFPQQWVAKPRQQARVTDTDRQLIWEVGSDQLQKLTGGQLIWSPPACMYINGFMLSLGAKCTVDGSARCLGLCSGVDDEVKASGISWSDKAAVMLGPVTVALTHGQDGEVISKEMEQDVLMGWDFTELDDFLSGSAPTRSELLAPYLKEGKLHVEARFTTVDEVW